MFTKKKITKDITPQLIKNKVKADSSLSIPIINYYNDYTVESIVMVNRKTRMKEGLAQLFYKNGNIKQEGVWHNNKQEGVWKFYDVNGNITAKVSFKNDYQDGVSIFYNYKGKIIEKSDWEKGKLNGRVIEYYDNGKIKSDAKWLLGKKLNEKKFALNQ